MLFFKQIVYLANSCKNVNSLTHVFQTTRLFSSKIVKNSVSQNVLQRRQDFLRFLSSSNTHDNVSSIQLKKRPIRKKKTFEDEALKPGLFNVVAFATAEEYDLEKLCQGLKEQDLYEPYSIENNNEVIHAIAKYRVDKEPRELFFFREGGVVLWNVTDLESSNILSFVRLYENDSYSERLVQSESEIMNYRYEDTEGMKSTLDKDGNFVLVGEKNKLSLEKYTFSNALFLSVKLGIWEACLQNYIDKIEEVTEDLKTGKRIKMSREEVLRKHGELFALRHYLNLSSDVLDTPDFYWENEHLESLYNQVCGYFGIGKRTKVMNEKINHCELLVGLLSSHLTDKHNVRLEWVVILLIMVEVAFEIVHYVDKYVH